jgi:PHD/YefM family antitoxin component YafN of YafNO toxin-antitoxin module
MEILPISAMRDTNMISEIVTQQKEPVFITKNGTGHLVILEHGEYMKMKEEMRLYKSAVDSIKRYKESGEELIDFDELMGEMERESENNTVKGSTE